MTHPITPPPELLQQWASEWMQLQNVNRDNFMATRAAQWGANQELEACVEWISKHCATWTNGKRPEDELRAARRPEPPSLKQQALEALKRHQAKTWCEEMDADIDTIRRALEALPNE